MDKLRFSLLQTKSKLTTAKMPFKIQKTAEVQKVLTINYRIALYVIRWHDY